MLNVVSAGSCFRHQSRIQRVLQAFPEKLLQIRAAFLIAELCNECIVNRILLEPFRAVFQHFYYDIRTFAGRNLVRETESLGIRTETVLSLILTVIDAYPLFISCILLKVRQDGFEVFIDPPADFVDVKRVDDPFQQEFTCNWTFTLNYVIGPSHSITECRRLTTSSLSWPLCRTSLFTGRSSSSVLT